MRSYSFITAKRHIEEVIMFPFILVGKLIAFLKPLEKEYDFFMFFPIYGIGGAERANVSVMEAVMDKKMVVFFTRKSDNDNFRHLFAQFNARLIDISRYTDNKFMYFANLIYRGICAHYINRQGKAPVVFNGQCNFAYKLFPHLKKEVLKVELIHTSEKKFSDVVFPYIPFIDYRVMVSDNIINDYIQYYRKLGIPSKYESRIKKIFYTIPVPPQLTPKSQGERLKVYYMGRGGYQKRLDVLFSIVRQCLKEGLPIEFHFAGSFKDEIPGDLFDKVHWYGIISDTDEVYKLHQQMDVFLLTSRFEGFPLAIMESMSCGGAIVATAVDGIPEHIYDRRNGLLIHETKNDQKIAEEGLEHLKTLLYDPALRASIAANNHSYALNNFGKPVFEKAYRELFNLPS